MGYVGDNTIKPLIKFILKLENPVGHIRFETTNTNPADYLGFGTWELWGAGRVPVGVNANETEFNSVEKTGGEKTHTLSINEIPNHNHNEGGNVTYVGGGIAGTSARVTGDGDSYRVLEFQSRGGSQAHNNLQPYITCYMWKRTA